eukprot:TRINITY_DN16504_c0_g1_i4.p2 TRINITY_DN16504_c0_g1~~TRINITY_DN16504_c0_g1_i4.p2  ORF type:complete len:418 (+),score=105.52 TRINITY_DN16504_c0_g1_i4:113-1255(+)
MPPQPSVELSADTVNALAGQMEVHGTPEVVSAYEEILCVLCHTHTLASAVITPCEHVYHADCLNRALRHRPGCCPTDRQPFPPGKPAAADVARQHRRMGERAPVLCPQGCGKVMPFEQLRGHVHGSDGCPNTPYRCGNKGCRALFKRCDMVAHLAQCPHRVIPCALCKSCVRYSRLQQHAAECPRRTVECAHCGKRYVSSEESAHMRRGCTGPALMTHVAQLTDLLDGQQRIIAELREAVRSQQAWIDQQRQQQQQKQQRRQQQQQQQERHGQQEGEEANIIEVYCCHHGGYEGRYEMLPQVRVNGAPVWGKQQRRVYRSAAGHWALASAPEDPAQNHCMYRTVLTGVARPNAPVLWEFVLGDADGPGGDPRSGITVAAA